MRVTNSSFQYKRRREREAEKGNLEERQMFPFVAQTLPFFLCLLGLISKGMETEQCDLKIFSNKFEILLIRYA